LSARPPCFFPTWPFFSSLLNDQERFSSPLRPAPHRFRIFREVCLSICSCLRSPLPHSSFLLLLPACWCADLNCTFPFFSVSVTFDPTFEPSPAPTCTLGSDCFENVTSDYLMHPGSRRERIGLTFISPPLLFSAFPLALG